MKTLEQQALEAGGSMKLDFDAAEPDSEWCPIMVNPALIEKLDEIGKRVGESAEQVLIKAVLAYDDATKEKS